MGWTETSAMHRKANGQADVKAELDAHYTWSDNVHTSKVLKSQIRGGEFHKSVYYAAVERKEQPYHAAMRTDDTEGREVYCAVVLIEDAIDPNEFDFLYKEMDEFAGPAEQHCPASILNLLTPTDHEWATEWRNQCRENAEDKAFRAKLARLPLGTRIEWQLEDDMQIRIGNPGDTYTLVRERVGKSKRWMLYYPGGCGYISPKHLNRRNVTILSEPNDA